MPSTDNHPPGPGETIIRRTTTRYSKKVPWLPLIIAAIAVPLLLTALATLTGIGDREPIETDLTARSEQALADAGISGAKVDFEGRDGSISGVSPDQQDAAQQAVDGVDGVRVAEVAGAGGDGGSDGGLTIDTTADAITLSGEVPDDATKQELVEAAKAKADGREVIDELTVAEGAKPGLDGAGVGSILGAAGTDAVNVKADGETVTLTGGVTSEATKKAVTLAATRAAPEATIDNQLTVDEEKAALQKQIDALIKAQGITFETNSAKLTPGGAKTVRKVAAALKKVPEANIRVDGHFAGNFGSEAHQLSLTEERASAVKAQLVKLGISDERITTKGFGSTKPIADEKTPEGQAANRRVEINVL